jgi:hypothetical protein
MRLIRMNDLIVEKAYEKKDMGAGNARPCRLCKENND